MKNLGTMLLVMASIGLALGNYGTSVHNPPNGVKILKHTAYCSNRGGRAGSNHYSKNVGRDQPISKCADVVRANSACSPYFSMGQDGWCDCVPKGQSCNFAEWPHYTAAQLQPAGALQVFYDHAARNYQQAIHFCQSKGFDGLATRADFCPNGPRTTPVGGQYPGDLWSPVSDSYNQWVHTGRDTWPECIVHTDIAGKPVWGTTTGFPGPIMCSKRGGLAYVGCYRDEGHRDIPVQKPSQNGMMPTQCSAACAGYAYFSVQNTNECWCGNSYGKYGKAAESECKSCAADGSLKCGGGWRNSVYKQPSGCWTKHANKFLGGYVGGLRINDITLEAAQVRCDNQPTCGGVTRESSGMFTVRMGPHLGNSPSGEISWIRCGQVVEEDVSKFQTILNLASAPTVALVAVAVAVVVALVVAAVMVRRRQQVTEESAEEEDLEEELLA